MANLSSLNVYLKFVFLQKSVLCVLTVWMTLQYTVTEMGNWKLVLVF